MCCTCNHNSDMSRMIQIRNVPDDVHRKLKARAAMAGMTLSEYLLREVAHVADRPTLEELEARIRSRSRRLRAGIDSAAAVRAEREARR